MHLAPQRYTRLLSCNLLSNCHSLHQGEKKFPLRIGCILFSNCYSLYLIIAAWLKNTVVFYFQIAITDIQRMVLKEVVQVVFEIRIATKYLLRPSLYCCIKHFQIVKVENKINEELYHYSN